MKIAITGGSGFIGSWFINKYKSHYDFIVVGRNKSISTINIKGKDYQYNGTDYSINSLCDILKDVNCVIHLAAQLVDKNNDAFTIYVEPNIINTSNLLAACSKMGILNVINVSSRMVYSDENTLPWIENEDPRPKSFYGISKLTAEKLAHYYNEEENMSIKSLRVAQVIGGSKNKNKGFFVNKYIQHAINKKTLIVFGKGYGKREFIYIKDVVGAINNAILNKNKKGIFNIGLGENITYNQLADMINEVFDNHGNRVNKYPANEDKGESLLSIEKAKKELGFAPEWSLMSSFQDMKKYLI